MNIRWKTASARLLVTWPGYAKSFVLFLRHLVLHADARRKPEIGATGFDIVTVVFKAELTLLRLQARSLALFLDPEFSGTIVLIVNDLDQRRTLRLLTRFVLPEYGPWRDRVEIVPFFKIGYGLDPCNGWIVQQALKLAVSFRIARPFYVLLDAKNHLIRPARLDMFVGDDGIAKQPMHARQNFLPNHWRACLQYLGQDPDRTTFAPCAPMTPFVMHTQTVRRLVEHVEAKERRTIFSFFINTRLISEFLLYQIYLNAVSQDRLAELYFETPELAVTIWPQCDEFRSELEKAEHDGEKIIFGYHRERLKKAGDAEIRILESFWRRHGLLGPSETLMSLAVAKPFARGSLRSRFTAPRRASETRALPGPLPIEGPPRSPPACDQAPSFSRREK